MAIGGADRCWLSGALIVYKLRGAYARAGMGLLPLAGRVVRAFTPMGSIKGKTSFLSLAMFLNQKANTSHVSADREDSSLVQEY